ncbi:MAG: hypothetical protein K5881_08050 [Saccharofermentans sp.]|jgi:hypothetical protein|nr:hypothetical protein [Saccharofermentans sp.]
MSYGRVRKPARKASYGTTEHDVEKKRTKTLLICALILIACGILDVIFLIGILDL